MILFKRFKKQVKDKKNVIGIEEELVPREREGKFCPEELVLRVYVDKKQEIGFLRPEDVVPPVFEGVGTDVVEIGKIKAFSLDPKKKYRPFPAGVSAMNYQGTACTHGYFAIDKEDGGLVILCNCHCGARENKAKIGEAYLQPSPYDGGLMKDKIGELKRFVPLQYEAYACPFRSLFGLRNWWRKRNTAENIVDLAVIKITEGDPLLEILNIGKIYGKRDPKVGDICQKCGRTTGLTKDGEVIGTKWSGRVSYSRGTCYFKDCAIIRKDNFSAGGDSSSGIIVGMIEQKPVFLGLLFAGSDSHTIFCKLSNIEKLGTVEVYESEKN